MSAFWSFHRSWLTKTQRSEPSSGSRGRGQTLRRRVVLGVESLEERVLMASAVWDGGGDGISWLDHRNWSGDALPGAADAVSLGTANVRIAGDVAVQRLDAGGVLTVVQGHVVVSDGLRLTPNASLIVSGAGTSFHAEGETRLDGVSLQAADGGAIELPGLVNYDHAATGNHQMRRWRASGASSAIDLPNLRVLTGGTAYDSHVSIEASAGGAVRLPTLTQIVDPNSGDGRYRDIAVSAEGTGSTIDLHSLASFVDVYAGSDGGENRYSSLTAVNGGELDLSSFTTGIGLRVTLDGTGATPLGQLRTLNDSRLIVSGTAPALNSLVETTRTGIEVRGSSLTLPNLTAAPAASFFVSAGGTLALPGLLGYSGGAFGNNRHVRWQALGAGITSPSDPTCATSPVTR